MSAVAAWVTGRWRWFVGLGAMWLLIAVPSFPGRANFDTISMVENMDAGAYTDWWSPLLMIAWKPFYELGFGLGFILLGQIAAMFVAVGALVRPLFRTQWAAVLAAAAVCLFPTSYAMLINVIRDTWFTVAILGCLAVVYRTRQPRPIHGALLALGLLTVMAARQNGVPVVMVLAGAAALHWGFVARYRTTVRRAAAAVVVGVIVGVAVFGLAQAMVRVADVEATGPEAVLYYVDVDEMSTRVGEFLVPDVFLRQPVTLDQLAEERNYRLEHVEQWMDLRLPPEDRPAAREAWIDAVTEHPVVYLQSRWQLFTRQAGWSGAPLEAHFPTDVSNAEFPLRWPGLAERASGYLEMFDGGEWYQGGFVHRGWPYVVVAGIAAWRLGRRAPLLFTIPAIQGAVFAGLFFLAPISKARLIYPVYALGLVALVYLFAAGNQMSDAHVEQASAMGASPGGEGKPARASEPG